MSSPRCQGLAAELFRTGLHPQRFPSNDGHSARAGIRRCNICVLFCGGNSLRFSWMFSSVGWCVRQRPEGPEFSRTCGRWVQGQPHESWLRVSHRIWTRGCRCVSFRCLSKEAYRWLCVGRRISVFLPLSPVFKCFVLLLHSQGLGCCAGKGTKKCNKMLRSPPGTL